MSDETDSEEELMCVHELAPKPRRVHLHEWAEEHYDVLSELYSAFKRDGEAVFGRSFHQFGDIAKPGSKYPFRIIYSSCADLACSTNHD